jgi:hypothetical protein
MSANVEKHAPAATLEAVKAGFDENMIALSIKHNPAYRTVNPLKPKSGRTLSCLGWQSVIGTGVPSSGSDFGPLRPWPISLTHADQHLRALMSPISKAKALGAIPEQIDRQRERARVDLFGDR